MFVLVAGKDHVAGEARYLPTHVLQNSATCLHPRYMKSESDNVAYGAFRGAVFPVLRGVQQRPSVAGKHLSLRPLWQSQKPGVLN